MQALALAVTWGRHLELGEQITVLVLDQQCQLHTSLRFPQTSPWHTKHGDDSTFKSWSGNTFTVTWQINIFKNSLCALHYVKHCTYMLTLAPQKEPCNMGAMVILRFQMRKLPSCLKGRCCLVSLLPSPSLGIPYQISCLPMNSHHVCVCTCACMQWAVLYIG